MLNTRRWLHFQARMRDKKSGARFQTWALAVFTLGMTVRLLTTGSSREGLGHRHQSESDLLLQAFEAMRLGRTT